MLDKIASAQKESDNSHKNQEQCREKLVQAETRHQANENKLLELQTKNELDDEVLRQHGAQAHLDSIEQDKIRQDKPFQTDV